ncbi:pyrophosphate--fructose 6-phosphate 1-phosphotransferase subunit beta 1-like isoform X5 [Benincasa hispida]|uniref:pyrophosphate--fructose 6-phosphate 1-phosphotransferase subunit beta 1-like isoform X5 n=1 Tax=Benincasa hispida TaxID=102211 RepID=UPI001901CCBD|nr:pyrophosphate--fructose 6-phosphate 1-phosphotransferase subunit beta 1-like isoform X5 [Benincasa hispida]XP_038877474.1 pyrophosphate--fructose 6-phosphate 1-phosphotransferase subunit beta 1-like isoform X5 [Benincasa hispida]XP_038877475.1 pyrophosphate--fructose 6-phosphate 1-phosphotransferase subunit beta 1-like isoform X5 [Benincasa hispida]XP_038877476.1 pyrophosphate--fructose 6-phosphate 1-phosphotransferase subunit beta 1-like isoform X5 [Benincasa hispida]
MRSDCHMNAILDLNAFLFYRGGFDMICSGRDKIETSDQFKQAEETVQKLDLDSNTNACLLAENFRSKNLKTRVICCPKTIDGDLKCKEVPTCFGFDYACKVLISLCNCFRIHISYGPNFGERCKVEVVSSRIRGKIGMSHS